MIIIFPLYTCGNYIDSREPYILTIITLTHMNYIIMIITLTLHTYRNYIDSHKFCILMIITLTCINSIYL